MKKIVLGSTEHTTYLKQDLLSCCVILTIGRKTYALLAHVFHYYNQMC